MLKNINNISKDQMIKDVKKIICKVARIDESLVDETKSLRNDLWIDSLQAIQVVAMIEEKFNIKIDEVEIFNVDNISEITELILEYLDN